MAAMQAPATHHIAFLGGGNMARALIAGLLRQGTPPAQIHVGEPLEAARAALQREYGIDALSDNTSAIERCELVVLAVKPQQASEVLRALGAALAMRPRLLLSIAAGLRSADLARLCPAGVSIVRAMPNRPALVGAGITALYAEVGVSAAQRSLAEQVASAAGRTVWLPLEAQLDIVTALSGSGPAYFFLLAEQLAAAAQGLGLAPETAQLLAAETLYGAGQLAHAGPGLAEQRAAVTSKAGTTEAALNLLQQQGFAPLVARALQAAAARSSELAAALGSAL